MYNNFYQPQQYSFPSTQTNKIYVSGIEDVRLRPQQVNSDMIYIHNDKPLLYQKIVNDKGQFEVKTFKITPEDEEEKKPDYVLKSDIEELQNKVKELESKLATRRIETSGITKL